ncbi:MAG: alpha-glucan family phosphorylase [Bacteroidota bacterium]
MNKLKFFNVAPKIPGNIQFLETLSWNLWWSWKTSAKNLFRRIDPNLWYDCERNPIALLSLIPQERLEELAEDEGFLNQLAEIKEEFEEEINSDKDKRTNGEYIAYFSLEYGLHESLRIYSGGLGILAGDHLKTASDLNMDLIGIGLFYREGYFRQHLNNDGFQEEEFPPNKLEYMPMQRAIDKEGNELVIELKFPDGQAQAIVWLVKVGRTRLYLIDTNIPENKPEHRDITSQLYGGDRTNRLRQELLLGIGGLEAIKKMGYNPKACHINEGHAAFLNIARLNQLIQNHNLTFDEALELTSRTKIFTTHTPVAAGHETFKPDILKKHLDPIMEDYAITPEEIFSLAQIPGPKEIEDSETNFSMTILGFTTTAYSNGVSKLHGKVSREMWQHLWPEHSKEEIPISHITNGVHLSTWASEEITRLMERYIGSGWDKNLITENELKSINTLLPEELWHAHLTARSRLIATIRKRQTNALKAKGAPRKEIERTQDILENDTLTIGFARRFASYKRATLLLHDIERFKKLITNEEYPVQFIFAGKAHPQDNTGKELIKEIYNLTKDETLSKRIVFVEDYDMFIAERLVQGVDVWLNTPRRPREASGTSGMKAALNGVINCSILDGWWDEAYNGDNGWAIGHGETYADHNYQDHKESQHLYHILEDEIIPLYYESKKGQVPEVWVTMMKESLKTALSYFSSFRMLMEYRDKTYIPAYKDYNSLIKNNFGECKQKTKDFLTLKNNWQKITIKELKTDKDLISLRVGEEFTVTSIVFADEIDPDLIEAEVFYGPLGPLNFIEKPSITKMNLDQKHENGKIQYSAVINCEYSGRYGFTVRVVPKDKNWKNSIPGLITWADI